MLIQFDTVTVKQIPDDYAALMGLDKYNRSKMPKTFEYLQPGISPDGRYLTGFDEDSMAIRQLPDSKRKEKYEKTKEFRESLQRLTGIPDLSGTSTYWETYGVKLSADSDLILNGQNPADLIKYCVLIANRFAAPDYNSSSQPEYNQTKFYLSTKEKVEAETVTAQKIKDNARSRLFEIAEDKERMVLIGQYLEGDVYKPNMSLNTLYKMLSDFIENMREVENRKKFVKAMDTPVEELQFKITVDRALKKKIIKNKDGYYQRGQVTLGRNPSEVLSNLRKPEFAHEFLSIKDELDL